MSFNASSKLSRFFFLHLVEKPPSPFFVCRSSGDCKGCHPDTFDLNLPHMVPRRHLHTHFIQGADFIDPVKRQTRQRESLNMIGVTCFPASANWWVMSTFSISNFSRWDFVSIYVNVINYAISRTEPLRAAAMAFAAVTPTISSTSFAFLVLRF